MPVMPVPVSRLASLLSAAARDRETQLGQKMSS